MTHTIHTLTSVHALTVFCVIYSFFQPALAHRAGLSAAVAAVSHKINKHIRADASVGIAYASVHAEPAVQNLKPHADALSH